MSDRPTLEQLGITPSIAKSLADAGYAIVPLTPTQFMLDQAWAAAMAEKADEVWVEMIEAWEAEANGFVFIDRQVRKPVEQVLAEGMIDDVTPASSHLINSEFQSDKYPTCPRGKVPLSVKDKSAQDLLWEYAQRRRVVDAQFSADLETALQLKGFVPLRPR